MGSHPFITGVVERLIAAHWKDVLPLAASVRTGTVSASLMMKRPPVGEGRAPMDLSQFRKNLDQQGSPLASADPAVDMALICNTALSDTVCSMEEMLKATTDRMTADQVKANEDVVSDIASPLGLS